ncbi:hypothetical protein ACVW1A_007731 [Bradyrhizobium sp. LB1.3]
MRRAEISGELFFELRNSRAADEIAALEYALDRLA